MRKKWVAAVAAWQALALLLFAAVCFSAGQEKSRILKRAATAAAAQVAKQVVPDNPSEHAAPAQPLPYSHKKHLALGLNCKDCHTNPEPGKLMTFPDTAKCMQCHATIAKDKPAIQKLAEFAKSKRTIPWVRVYTVLPGVAWSHRPHLQAGVACETCHRSVREMEQMSEVTSVTSMAVCLNCHETNNAKTACDTCHKS